MTHWLQKIRNQDHPARFLISRVLWRAGLLTLLRFKFKRNGYFLRLSPTSLAMSLWVEKKQRDADSNILKLLLRPGDHYIDVGANVGHLAIEGRLLVGDSGCVTAVEAHPRTAAFLRDNFLLNNLGDIRVANIALGESSAWVHFSDIRSDDQNGIIEMGGINVPCLPLDAIETGEKIMLLKIDVEGYEKFVLKGAHNTLDKVEFIYFEAWDAHFAKYNYEFSEIADYLFDHGFELGVPSYDGVEVISNDFNIPKCINLLAFRSREFLSGRSGWRIHEK